MKNIHTTCTESRFITASLSAVQDCGRERMITVTSGLKCYGQYGRYSPLGSLVRTLLGSSRWYSPVMRLRWDAQMICSRRITYTEKSSGSPSTKSAKVLSVRDMPSNRLLFRLVPSARPTGETACGLLPTVQTQGLKRCNAKGMTEFVPLYMLPTPTSIDAGSGRINKSPSTGAKERPTIALAARMGLLPSPVASDATTGAIIGECDRFVTTGNGTLRKVNRNGTNESVGLARMVQLLPTPNAAEGEKYTTRYNPDSQMGKGLTAMAVNDLLPTPRANKVTDINLNNKRLSERRKANLEESIAKVVTNCQPTDGATSQLNPLFVCDMMGFPITWLDI